MNRNLTGQTSGLGLLRVAASSNTLATLVVGTWGIVFATLAIGWPLFLRILSLRQYPANKHLYDYWQGLRDLEHDLALIDTPADAQLIMDQLDEMLQKVLETWFEDDLIEGYYDLRSTIRDVRAQAELRLESLLNPPEHRTAVQIHNAPGLNA